MTEATATYTCIKCGADFDPPGWLRARSEHACLPCRNKRRREYRVERAEMGKPLGGGPSLPWPHRREYNRLYLLRPEVREHNAARARARRFDPNVRMQAKVRRIVRSALEKGLLVKEPCGVCGDRTVDGHHDDYTKPLEVRWLCHKHHMEHHAAMKKAADEATS